MLPSKVNTFYEPQLNCYYNMLYYPSLCDTIENYFSKIPCRITTAIVLKIKPNLSWLNLLFKILQYY